MDFCILYFCVLYFLYFFICIFVFCIFWIFVFRFSRCYWCVLRLLSFLLIPDRHLPPAFLPASLCALNGNDASPRRGGMTCHRVPVRHKWSYVCLCLRLCSQNVASIFLGVCPLHRCPVTQRTSEQGPSLPPCPCQGTSPENFLSLSLFQFGDGWGEGVGGSDPPGPGETSAPALSLHVSKPPPGPFPLGKPLWRSAFYRGTVDSPRPQLRHPPAAPPPQPPGEGSAANAAKTSRSRPCWHALSPLPLVGNDAIEHALSTIAILGSATWCLHVPPGYPRKL